CARGGPMACW
nr:immunoglobulin heavy chain junction region [Mus musculus]